MKLIVGIDASRNRSGGAKAYLAGILAGVDPRKHGIREVHLWAFKSLLDSIPDQPWLIKHNPRQLEQSLTEQLCWQAFRLTKAVKVANCDILFTTDASTLCRFKPMVVLSQDLLSYEPGVVQFFGYGFARLRLLIILYLQNFAFRHADGVIFLTQYSGEVIQKSCGALNRVVFIPHGVGAAFKNTPVKRPWPENSSSLIQCLYVSNVAHYKHQWHVVRAITILRNKGFNLQLTLTGGGAAGSASCAQKTLDSEIERSDPAGLFVRQLGFVSPYELPQILSGADLFIFASSCETFGITLLEAMAVGLPIACSNRSSLPETLSDGGVYFDPEDPDSIAKAIEQIITKTDLRSQISKRAKKLSQQYSWERCADDTFAFIVETARATKKML